MNTLPVFIDFIIAIAGNMLSFIDNQDPETALCECPGECCSGKPSSNYQDSISKLNKTIRWSTHLRHL